MSAADRVITYSDDFAGYGNSTLLTDYPPWLALGDTAPIVFNDNTFAAIYPPENTEAAAVYESICPQDCFAAFAVDDASGGAGAKAGVGVLVRLGLLGEDYWFYRIMANATSNTVGIWKVDSRTTTDSLLVSESVTISSADEFWCEIDTDGAGTTTIRVYNAADQVIATASDGTELTGDYVCLVVSGTGVGIQPQMSSIALGALETSGNRRLDTVNPGNVVQSKGNITLTGVGLSDVDSAKISLGGARPYTCAISNKQSTQITITPVDIAFTQLPYGTLTMTLEHATDPDVSKTFTMEAQAGWQSVTLSGATDNTLLLTGTVATNSDTMEIPNNDGFSTFTLSANGDVLIDSAANQGMVFERRLYDQTNSSWNVGNVTINQIDDTGGELVPPSWRSTPAPPDAVVGVYYEFPIGVLIDGSRPMTLTQAPGSNALPTGLNYNSSKSPETIEGTVTSGTGSITVPGIITRATNGA
jgi:hypothetical protein